LPLASIAICGSKAMLPAPALIELRRREPRHLLW
jgi:hypothetical protein